MIWRYHERASKDPHQFLGVVGEIHPSDSRRHLALRTAEDRVGCADVEKRVTVSLRCETTKYVQCLSGQVHDHVAASGVHSRKPSTIVLV
jgi:hypothetical protein